MGTVTSEALHRLARRKGARDDADARVTNAIINARKAGASWQDIADVLGTSKQAAHERYRWLDGSTARSSTDRRPQRGLGAGGRT